MQSNRPSYSRHVEKYLAAEAPHKHLVFVLNKIDLVPSKTAVCASPAIRTRSYHMCQCKFAKHGPTVGRKPSLGPQGFCQGVFRIHCTMEVVRYTAGRVISTSYVLGLVIRSRTDGLCF